MRTIYEPAGRAKEYSPLALNLYDCCNHGCRYCFANDIPGRKGMNTVEAKPVPRPNILEELEKCARKMRGDPREILLCFTCDPYPVSPCVDITRDALLILEEYELSAQVLTKGGMRAARDFDILKRNGWKFGTTLHCIGTDRTAIEWEPNAAHPLDRIQAIVKAKTAGISTWVSVEPVINPDQALDTIALLRPHVDFWKIGKLNHFPDVEKKVDWGKFLKDVKELIGDRPHLIKADLLKHGGAL